MMLSKFFCPKAGGKDCQSCWDKQVRLIKLSKLREQQSEMTEDPPSAKATDRRARYETRPLAARRARSFASAAYREPASASLFVFSSYRPGRDHRLRGK